MQIFEIGLFSLMILWVINSIFRRQYCTIIGFVMIAFLVCHLIFESTRWQLYPIYLGSLICFFISLYVFAKKMDLRIERTTKKIILPILIFLIFISISSSLIFPVYDMPLPSGEYSVGTVNYELIDYERSAIYSDNLNDNRRIKIQLWYPADSIEGFDRVPWLEDGKTVARLLANDMNLPSFVLDHTALVQSNSYKNAPINEDLESFPIIIISHGWRGFRNLHTDLAEELASQGYVVVSIDHTYGSQSVVFSDGEVANINYDALPKREMTPDFIDYANALVNTYAGDIILTIDQLEKMNNGQVDSIFNSKLDLSRLGLLGHSTGGGADVAAALKDDRIKTLIGMDAWVEPLKDSKINQGLDIPALFLRSGEWEVGLNNSNLLALMDASDKASELYQLAGSTHSDFSMVYMYSPLTKYIGITGDIEGDEVLMILKDLISGFYEKNLNSHQNIDIGSLAEKWTSVRKIK